MTALGLIACGSVSTAPPPAPGASWTGSPVVATRFGAVQGQEDADQTWVWKAIPFACPPVGGLRWRAPQDPAPWAGVRRMASFANECTQFSAVFAGSIQGSEDCLYLNVWRPRDAETGLPVYVWIHGGGNSTGAPSLVREFYGNRIAARSRVVFVALAYRLGPFGWFTLPALRDGTSPEDASGNYGTLDLVQRLRWIQQNIEAFGGDPRRVTLTGESAGGINVLSLLISPPAKGLFQGAISESGGALTRSVEEADASANGVLRRLLVKTGRARSLQQAAEMAQAMSAAEIRDFLRSRSDREILSQYRILAFGNIDFPNILRDGAVIPADGYGALTTGVYPNRVPLILGSNADELKLFLRFATHLTPGSELYQAVSRYGTERWAVSAVDGPARRLVSHADQPPVYAYSLRWGTVEPDGTSVLPGFWGRDLGTFHSLDIPFFLGHDTLPGLFHLFLFTNANAPGRKALSADIMRYTAAFARTGDPNPGDDSLPRWEPWSGTPGGPRRIVFDAGPGQAHISMSGDELTDRQVMAAAGSELSEPLRSEVLEFLRASPLPSGVH